MTTVTFVSPQQKQRLGLFFKQKRLSSKVSVSVLSSKISRSETYYYRLERGSAALNPSIIKTLFDFYGVKYEKSF